MFGIQYTAEYVVGGAAPEPPVPDDWSLLTFWRRLVGFFGRFYTKSPRTTPHIVAPHRVGPFMVN